MSATSGMSWTMNGGSFQLERDKLHTFWEITQRQLEEKAELQNKDREMEEAEERHQVEIKVSGASPPVLLQPLEMLECVCGCRSARVCSSVCVGRSVWGQ